MKRKLIKQAGQAVTITLPIEWIRKNGLKAGNEIELRMHENDLVLTSGKKTKGGSTKLSIVGFSKRMKYGYINSNYARGVDEIEIEAERDWCPDLNQNIGYAAVSQKGDRFIVKDVSGIASENLDDIFKRVFQMIMSFYDSAIEDIFGERCKSYEHVKKRDKEINKFTLFLERAIIKQAYPDPDLGKIMFAYSFALEKLGDEILRMWRVSIQKKVKTDAKIKEIVLLSKKILQKSFEVYYRHIPEMIKELIALRDTIRNKTAKIKGIGPATIEFMMHAIKIAEDSYDLTHLSIMKSLKIA